MAFRLSGSRLRPAWMVIGKLVARRAVNPSVACRESAQGPARGASPDLTPPMYNHTVVYNPARSKTHEADRIDDADLGRRVPGPWRSRRRPPRRVRARRMDGGIRRRADVAPADRLVRARGCPAARTQDVG